ncbi:MAG: DUF4097 family beta strand repeat protein [Chloroflexi bacterium]|nr:DUF4097 family beta strand repeat protein [Chloroflexota bacterium]
MPKQIFAVNPTARVKIRDCQGRVSVYGADGDQVIVEADETVAHQDGETILIERADDVIVTVPRGVTITMENCDADFRLADLTGLVGLENISGDVVARNISDLLIRELNGDLAATRIAHLKGEGTWNGDVSLRGVEKIEINEIQDDLNIADAGAVTIQTIRGDFSARAIRGALTVQDVHADISLRDLDGALTIARAHADLIAANVRGAVNITDVEGDAVISFAQVADVNLRADGDVILNFPADVNARVELDAPRGALIVHAEMNVTERAEDRVRGTIGAGGATVRAESTRGDLILRVGEARDARARHSGRQHPAAEFAALGAEFGAEARKMGMEIRRKVRESLVESLGESRGRGHRRHLRHALKHLHADDDVNTETPHEEKPRGPAAGSPERQAILDAIARGEMNVDDAIKKIRGEE